MEDDMDDMVVDAIWIEVQAIVDRHGGDCFECFPLSLDPNRVPFADLWKLPVPD